MFRYLLAFIFFANISLADNRETIEVNIIDHKFDPHIIKVASGAKLKIVVNNLDNTVEEFESIDLKREKIVPPKGKINVMIGPLKKGEYAFFGEFHQDTAQGKIIVE